jgi:hypothetical protein
MHISVHVGTSTDLFSGTKREISVTCGGLNKTNGSETDAINNISSGSAIRRRDLKSYAGLNIN